MTTAPVGETVRTASDPPVPAEEALAGMVAGNKRYGAGYVHVPECPTHHAGDARVQGAPLTEAPSVRAAPCASSRSKQTRGPDSSLLVKLSEGGQNPEAIVLGCADSRAPIEILFDVRPGDLFVLRNAGNTCAAAKSDLIGSIEYAISHLHTKLLVVTGHTKCVRRSSFGQSPLARAVSAARHVGA